MNTALTGLSPANQAALKTEGLIKFDEWNENRPVPLWRTTVNFHRNQTFPVGRPVTVEHSYAPIAGGSVGGSLDPQYRNADTERHYADTYCADASFLSGITGRYTQARRRNADAQILASEVWLGYVLKSGANWAGPIRDFTLTVDKGKANSLVSFCGTGVRRITPTQFQMRRTNFTPTQDLNILIVDF
jgi:hypothetical protein